PLVLARDARDRRCDRGRQAEGLDSRLREERCRAAAEGSGALDAGRRVREGRAGRRGRAADRGRVGSGLHRPGPAERGSGGDEGLGCSDRGGGRVMAEISAALVKELRERTGAPMMDCKRMLVETGGDIEQAIVLLRERGMAQAAKRAGRATSEGLVGYR